MTEPILHRIASPRGFTVLPVHYTHDPAKAGEAWRAAERAKYGTPPVGQSDWDQEMEIDFTAVSGVRAYPPFQVDLHVRPCQYDPLLPLRLGCDFNVDPFSGWAVTQVFGNILYVIDEVCVEPGDIPSTVTEFRRRYPAHPAGIWWYGDAAGNSRRAEVKDAKSAWDVVRLHMATYPGRQEYRIPAANPPVEARLRNVNNRLLDREGRSWVVIDPHCVELIADLTEVKIDERSGGIKEDHNRASRYFRRGHISAGLGYLISHEWPLIMEALELEQQRAALPPLTFRYMDGAI